MNSMENAVGYIQNVSGKACASRPAYEELFIERIDDTEIVNASNKLAHEFDEALFIPLAKAKSVENVLSLVMVGQVIDFFTLRNVSRGTANADDSPTWINGLDRIVREQVLHDEEEGYPIANEAAIRNSIHVARTIYNEFGNTAPEPYFDVAPDCGVDIYFDHAENELMIHVPPPGSTNLYCFTRINGERVVHRNPTFRQFYKFLQQVIG